VGTEARATVLMRYQQQLAEFGTESMFSYERMFDLTREFILSFINNTTAQTPADNL
jgi:hypothetical protein